MVAETDLARCSVVMPLKNDAAFIEQQLDALAGQTYTGWWEVVIADNGSTDGSPDIARRWSDRLPHLRIVDASGRPGASHARNTGWRHASGDVIMFCDSDDVVGADWLEGLAAGAADHGIVAGRREDERLNAPEHRPSPLFSEPRPDLPEFHFLPWAFGGNLAIRRTALDAVGGWNEDYLMGEDVELCWRLQLAGYTWGYAPSAVVHYRQRTSTKALARQRYNWGKNEPRFYRDFREHGFIRNPQPQAVRRDWWWIVTRSPFIVLGQRRRRMWWSKAADRCGRLLGSYRYRVWCP